MRAASRRYFHALLAIVLGVVSFAGGGAGSGDEIVPFLMVDDGATGIEDLRARDLSLPELGHDEICPVVTYPEPVFVDTGAGVRAGPVGAVGIGVNGVLNFDITTPKDWYSSKILWVLDADLPPLLVRGRRLDGPGKVAFRTSDAESEPSLVLDEDVQSTIGPEYRDQPSGPRVKRSGCYALQIDGPDFQSVIVFRAVVGDGNQSTRTFELRRLRLDAGEAVAFGLHHTNGVRISSRTPGLEVCPAELSEVYEGGHVQASSWFRECLPITVGETLDLPDTVIDHVAFLLRSASPEAVNVPELVVMYEPGDGFFFVAPPPLDPGEQSAALVITPTSWDVVAVDPSPGIDPLVTQHGRAIGAVELPDVGPAGTTHGPVTLGKPVVIRGKNPSRERRDAALAVTWA